MFACMKVSSISELKKELHELPQKQLMELCLSLAKYKKDNNKKFIFVKNGFGIHPMFNTVYGNKNRWNIGGENGEMDELNFYNDLTKKIIL